MPDTSAVYRPRKPQYSQYYQCVEDNFEEFERIYDDRFTTKTLEEIFPAKNGIFDRHKVFPAIRGTTFQGKNHGRPG